MGFHPLIQRSECNFLSKTFQFETLQAKSHVNLIRICITPIFNWAINLFSGVALLEPNRLSFTDRKNYNVLWFSYGKQNPFWNWRVVVVQHSTVCHNFLMILSSGTRPRRQRVPPLDIWKKDEGRFAEQMTFITCVAFFAQCRHCWCKLRRKIMHLPNSLDKKDCPSSYI